MVLEVSMACRFYLVKLKKILQNFYIGSYYSYGLISVTGLDFDIAKYVYLKTKGNFQTFQYFM